MDNAFDKLLATFESNYQVSLHFGDQRRMLVTVREGSLEQVSEAVHPAARSHSYLSLRATYTVGSMAGLGFSMAVVGLSIGIFVGFILWKGRLGLPYYYCSTRRVNWVNPLMFSILMICKFILIDRTEFKIKLYFQNFLE